MADTTKPKTDTASKKPAETLRWAYVITAGNDIEDAVVFGTNDDRTRFLAGHADKWWRIVDGPKGKSLRELLASTPS